MTTNVPRMSSQLAIEVSIVSEAGEVAGGLEVEGWARSLALKLEGRTLATVTATVNNTQLETENVRYDHRDDVAGDLFV